MTLLGVDCIASPAGHREPSFLVGFEGALPPPLFYSPICLSKLFAPQETDASHCIIVYAYTESPQQTSAWNLDFLRMRKMPFDAKTTIILQAFLSAEIGTSDGTFLCCCTPYLIKAPWNIVGACSTQSNTSHEVRCSTVCLVFFPSMSVLHVGFVAVFYIHAQGAGVSERERHARLTRSMVQLSF